MRHWPEREGNTLSGYTIALFIHFLSLLIATAAMAATFLAALWLRAAKDAGETARSLATIERIVPAFPVATLGLLASGAWMTESSWTWTTPWILGGLIGLALIVVLGAGIDGARNRALKRELGASGFSAKARAMLADPTAWAARLTMMTLLVAVVGIMAMKPSALGVALWLVVGVVAGVVAALPLRKVRVPAASS
jgi:hypothetical protein